MRKLLATLGILTLGGTVGADVASFDARVVPDQDIQIKGEMVKQRQIGNEVQVDLSWKGERGIKLKYDMGEATVMEKLRDKRNIEIITETQEDGFKVDFLLNEKPKTNVFCQTIENADDYNWYYQPPLTQEEIAEGAERPENVVGSYAVYHKTLANHRVGGVNYETGKAFHVYRPQVWSLSSSSTKEWAELSYDNGQLCVTVPQDFLDSVVYPVRVDPTFGVTSVGGTAVGNEDSAKGYTVTLSEDGDVSKLTVYSDTSSGSADIKGAIYSSDGNTLKGGIATNAATSNSTPAWRDMTFGSTISLTAADYILPSIHDEIGGAPTGRLYYDNTNQDGSRDDIDYLTFPPSSVTLSSFRRDYSIYATYQVSGGEESPPRQSEIWF